MPAILKSLPAFLGERLARLFMRASSVRAFSGIHPSQVEIPDHEPENYLLLVDLSAATIGQDPSELMDDFAAILAETARGQELTAVETFPYDEATIAAWVDTTPGGTAALVTDTIGAFTAECLPTPIPGAKELDAPVLIGIASPIEMQYLLHRFYQHCPPLRAVNHADANLLLRRLAERRLRFTRTRSWLYRAAIAIKAMQVTQWDQLSVLSGFRHAPPRVLELLEPTVLRNVVEHPPEQHLAELTRLLELLYAAELAELMAVTRTEQMRDASEETRTAFMNLLLLSFFLEGEQSLSADTPIIFP